MLALTIAQLFILNAHPTQQINQPYISVTAGELKESLENIPDDAIIVCCNDRGELYLTYLPDTNAIRLELGQLEEWSEDWK